MSNPHFLVNIVFTNANYQDLHRSWWLI